MKERIQLPWLRDTVVIGIDTRSQRCKHAVPRVNHTIPSAPILVPPFLGSRLRCEVPEKLQAVGYPSVAARHGNILFTRIGGRAEILGGIRVVSNRFPAHRKSPQSAFVNE